MSACPSARGAARPVICPSAGTLQIPGASRAAKDPGASGEPAWSRSILAPLRFPARRLPHGRGSGGGMGPTASGAGGRTGFHWEGLAWWWAYAGDPPLCRAAGCCPPPALLLRPRLPRHPCHQPPPRHAPEKTASPQAESRSNGAGAHPRDPLSPHGGAGAHPQDPLPPHGAPGLRPQLSGAGGAAVSAGRAAIGSGARPGERRHARGSTGERVYL